MQAPVHGEVTTKVAPDYPNFRHRNVRSVCNQQLVPLTQVWYTPQHGFVGDDAFGLDLIFSNGEEEPTWYTVHVR